MNIKLNILRASALIFVLLILGYMIIRAFIPANYKVNTDDLFLESTIDQSVNLFDFFINVNEKSDEILLVDIREASIYKNSHFDNAINIPFSDILKKRNLRKMKKNEVWIIAESELTAHDASFLLNQLGYKTKAVNGGYEILTKMKDSFNPAKGRFSDEKQKFDYPKYIKQMEGNPTEFKVDNKKEIATSGGC